MMVALPLSREWAPQRRAHKVHAVVEFAELAGAEATVKRLTDNTNWHTALMRAAAAWAELRRS